MFKKAFEKLKAGLSKTRKNFLGKLGDLIRGHTTIDDDLMEEIEELLISADVGVHATMTIIDRLQNRIKIDKIKDPSLVEGLLKAEIAALMGEGSYELDLSAVKPYVIMVVGVNGVGKTTTIGKIAARLKQEGKHVILAAGDTFRAAAIDQLEIWADRAGAQIVRSQPEADPAAVAFDAVDAALARNADVVLIDTAGRLHTKVNLMKELEKIKRVVQKRLPAAPHEILLVLDATTGQNAIQQAKLFNQVVDISGLVLTKLDGTAKGGIVIAIKDELNIPVKLIGVGEQVEDIQDFDPHDFVEALFA
ncbi:MAG: signal recognition particle-docking protein FtsY [Gemmatimonadetes bacterium]|nr:MAG: signal recognition particle-docking protein FtsY [Gemmatimonadota bacterium]